MFWPLAFSPFPVPPNGLVVYCGTIVTEEGKEKKVNIDFEPFKPINTSLYLCDNKFHTEVRYFASVFACDIFIVETILTHKLWCLQIIFFLCYSHHPFLTPYPQNRHWQPCCLMTVSLALLWLTVVGHCLAHCRATPGRCYISSLWTYPRSTVLTHIVLHNTELFIFLTSQQGSWEDSPNISETLLNILSFFQAEEGSLLCVLLAWEWRRDTTMWEKWLRRLSSSLCPMTKLMWRVWSWLALLTSRQSSASLTCLTQ